jgi:hypothetical protein
MFRIYVWEKRYGVDLNKHIFSNNQESDLNQYSFTGKKEPKHKAAIVDRWKYSVSVSWLMIIVVIYIIFRTTPVVTYLVNRLIVSLE